MVIEASYKRKSVSINKICSTDWEMYLEVKWSYLEKVKHYKA